jgi:hypothetical protein
LFEHLACVGTISRPQQFGVRFVSVVTPSPGKILTQWRFGLEARVGIGPISPRLRLKNGDFAEEIQVNID